jgi:menaquinol-cytochrome c reductase iron-sulfur subunit
MNQRLPNKITRRSFLSLSVKLALGSTGILLGSAGLFYYGSIQQHKRKQQADLVDLEPPGNIVNLGEFDRLTALQGVERVAYEATINDAWVSKPTNGFVYVTKDDNGDLLVLSPLCTHLGCNILPASNELRPVKSKDSFYQCPCHGAEFDIKGNCVYMGLRGLDTFKPIVVGGNVYIDISLPIQRSL